MEATKTKSRNRDRFTRNITHSSNTKCRQLLDRRAAVEQKQKQDDRQAGLCTSATTEVELSPSNGSGEVPKERSLSETTKPGNVAAETKRSRSVEIFGAPRVLESRLFTSLSAISEETQKMNFIAGFPQNIQTRHRPSSAAEASSLKMKLEPTREKEEVVPNSPHLSPSLVNDLSVYYGLGVSQTQETNLEFIPEPRREQVPLETSWSTLFDMLEDTPSVPRAPRIDRKRKPVLKSSEVLIELDSPVCSEETISRPRPTRSENSIGLISAALLSSSTSEDSVLQYIRPHRPRRRSLIKDTPSTSLSLIPHPPSRRGLQMRLKQNFDRGWPRFSKMAYSRPCSLDRQVRDETNSNRQPPGMSRAERVGSWVSLKMRKLGKWIHESIIPPRRKESPTPAAAAAAAAASTQNKGPTVTGIQKKRPPIAVAHSKRLLTVVEHPKHRNNNRSFPIASTISSEDMIYSNPQLQKCHEWYIANRRNHAGLESLSRRARHLPEYSLTPNPWTYYAPPLTEAYKCPNSLNIPNSKNR